MHKRIQIDNQAQWNDLLLALPAPHLLQSWTWGELKEAFGWRATRLSWTQDADHAVAAAQLLIRERAGGLKLAYCPKGPTLDWSHPEQRSVVLADLLAAARERGAFLLKIDPEVPYDDGPGQEVEQTLDGAGWRRSQDKVQFRNTLVLDLRHDEETLLANMKQKWRYNVRLAGRKGVQVRRAGVDDLELLYRMYAETSRRDGFVIRAREYYSQAWRSFTERGLAQPLIAEVDGEPVAGQVIYRYGKTGWYLYGMSTDRHREKMPNHLLHWEAIRWAREQGCETYDFVGAPDELSEHDPMWGVYRFKLGFGGRLVETIGEWDYPIKPAAYWAYQRLLPQVLKMMRMFGRRRVAGELE
jgi:lipid II:glycine glycyltransferase (peptidoglycan interpeptide bridge formation enzyme)